MSVLTKRAIFLDRDGTLNFDPGYLKDPDQLKLLPHVGEALSSLKQAGYLLVVVSNQSGIGRGLIQIDELTRVNERLGDLLKPWNVKIDHFELCIHHPDESCECRKPKPKLLQDAAQVLKVILTQSYMVGDKQSDVEAGLTAGCKGSLLVRTGAGTDTEQNLGKAKPHFIGDSLLEVARWILTQGNADS